MQLDEEVSSTYALACLGTETINVPDDTYLRDFGAEGLEETLSMTIGHVKAPNVKVPNPIAYKYDLDSNPQVRFHKEDTSRNYELHLLNDGAAIIDGPSRFKANVYYIISTSLLHLINQLAYGYRKIAMTGHSRGAIETVIISHELKRIKDAFLINENMTKDEFIQCVINSEHKLTREILHAWQTKLDVITQENFSTLKLGLRALRVNLFLIDPVAGGSVFGVTYGRWLDERFSSLPDIVEVCIQRVPDSELSRGFKGRYFKVADAANTSY
jgi:hypothetical protein